jgi:hypothetical protein
MLLAIVIDMQAGQLVAEITTNEHVFLLLQLGMTNT